MSISPVGSGSTQSLAQALLPRLQSTGAGGQDAGGPSSPLGDLLTLSPAARQLGQVPTAVTQAVTDLLSGQKAAAGDLAQLQAYLQKSPGGLAGLIASVQGDTGLQGASGSANPRDLLMTALLNHQSGNSDPRALLGLLAGDQAQDPLFAPPGE